MHDMHICILLRRIARAHCDWTTTACTTREYQDASSHDAPPEPGKATGLTSMRMGSFGPCGLARPMGPLAAALHPEALGDELAGVPGLCLHPLSLWPRGDFPLRTSANTRG